MNIIDWIKPLTEIFVGKKVVIEDENPQNPEGNEKVPGTCKAFHPLVSSLDIELADGTRYGFIPKTITKGLAEGETCSPLGLKRSIQLA